MIRLILLIAGIILLIIQQWIYSVPANIQFIFFITGIILVGIPHGAADLLVASKNAQKAYKVFSNLKFLSNYVLRLILFGVVLWLFPLTGNLLFIVFAAYHFGETDLHQFKTNTITGKIFVLSYGLVILGVILLNNFDDVQPLYLQFQSGRKYINFINFISQYRHVILSFAGVLFFISSFLYFSVNRDAVQQQGLFLVRFAVIILILYHLPLIMGFTFYFVFWHSILSLRNVVSYLRENNLHSMTVIIKQLVFYSMLAIAGISIFGLAGYLLYSIESMTVYVFLGLAVLTAPHLGVMYDMYKRIRNSKAVSSSN